MDIEQIIETFGLISIIILIIIIAYFITLLNKVSESAKNTMDIYNNQNEELEILKKISNELEFENKKIERIAKVLEEADTEPYYIKKDG